LVVFEEDVLMFENLWVFVFVVEVDGLESLWTVDGFVDEFGFAVAVGLSD
jgi:hypothetical protein